MKERIIRAEVTSPQKMRVLHNIFETIYRLFEGAGLPPYSSKDECQSEVKTVVSKEHKFVYIINPLCASRSLVKSLTSKTINGVKKKISKKGVKKLENKYFVFSIVRNPFERLVSCYNKKILSCDSIATILIVAQFKGLYPQMSFGKFVEWICSPRGRDENADPHWMSQHKILTDRNGNLLTDYLGKLESLERHVKNISRKAGVDINVGHVASSYDMPMKPIYNNHYEYYSELGDEKIKQVHKRYSTDFDIFGYNSILGKHEK